MTIDFGYDDNDYRPLPGTVWRRWLVVAVIFAVGVLMACVPARGGDYNVRTRTYSSRDYNHQQHRQIVRLVDVVQINPAYTSAYNPEAYDSATQTQLLAELHKIGARLDANAAERVAREGAQAALLQRLAAWQGVPGVPNPPAVPTPPPAYSTLPQPQPAQPGPLTRPAAPLSGLTVLNLKCAACHQDGKLLPNQKFILLDKAGQLQPLTPTQRLNVLGRTYEKTMPPPVNQYNISPIEDAEYAAILQVLRQ